MKVRVNTEKVVRFIIVPTSVRILRVYIGAKKFPYTYLA
jgi:hypothetical protein